MISVVEGSQRFYLADGVSLFNPNDLQAGDVVMLRLAECDVRTIREQGRITDVTTGQFLSVLRPIEVIA